MRVKIEPLNDEEVFIRIPEEVLKELGWKEGDILEIDISFDGYGMIVVRLKSG